jgi:CheY-like chemotaxis protein
VSKRKVLLIEDEKIDATGVGRVLKEFYPEVLLEVLTTGEHAIEWIHRFRQNGEEIALILMDMTLPRMDGLRLIPELRNHRDLRHTPIVVLSGNQSPTAIQHAYDSGACAYVVKRSAFADTKTALACMFHFWLGQNLLAQASQA